MQELIDGGALGRFQGNGQGGVVFNVFAELLPARQRMVEPQVGDAVARAIHNDDIVMVPGPIEAGVMRDFSPWFHVFAFGCSHRGTVGSHADTGSLAGYCSLRHCDSRYCGGR